MGNNVQFAIKTSKNCYKNAVADPGTGSVGGKALFFWRKYVE